MIPITLTWTAVQTAISDFLGNTLVVTGLTTLLALRFAPVVVRAIKRAVSSR